MTVELKPCGTRSANVRHLRHDEKPCEACRQANLANFAEARSAYSRARSRARQTLRDEHRPEFDELIEAEYRRRKPGEKSNILHQRAMEILSKRHPDRFAVLLAAERAREAATPTPTPKES